MTRFSEDPILRGLVRVVQPRRGYRFSLDSLLLADFALRARFRHALDLGCGSAVIAMILARRRPRARIVGLEIQAELCEAARRGVALNGLLPRIEIVPGDLREAVRIVPAASFGLVVCNPPFHEPARAPASPEAGRALGRHALCCTLDEVLAAARHACRPGGRVALIHPGLELPHLPGLTLRAIRPVVSRAGQPARRYLIELSRSSRGGARELAPLVVHEGAGYTEELRKILGDA